MVAKVGLGLVGLSAIGIGGVAFTKPEWLGINRETPWTPLSQDTDYKDADSGDAYKDKFGSTYKNYLVGTSQDNKAWWDEKVEKITGEKKGKFKSIGKGFDDNNSLKSLCEEAYKKTEAELKGDSPDPGNDDFRKSDVWKYCSPIGQEPTTVKAHDRSAETGKKYETTGGKTLIGSSEEESLVSVFDKGNDKFWDIRNQEFHKKRLFKEKGGMDVESTHAFFNKGKTDNKHIKDLCKEAYNMDSSRSTPTKDETKKYCSLKATTN